MPCGILEGAAVRDPTPREGADQPAEDQHDPGEQARLADGQVEPPVQDQGQPERVGRKHEEKEGLRADGGAQGWDPEQGEKLGQARVVSLLQRGPAALHAAAQGLAQPEGQQREQNSWDRREEEGASPAELLGDESPAGEADGDPHRAPGAPDRHDAAALLLGKVVGQQGGACRVVAGFPDSEHGAAQEELGEVAGEPCEEGGEAPDGDAGRDDCPANPTVRPVAEGDGGKRVNEKEGGAEETDQGIAEVEFLLDQGRCRRGDPPVHVVEEVDADHDREDVTCVTSRHGWNYEVGLRARRGEAPGRISYDYCSLVGRLGIGELKWL